MKITRDKFEETIYLNILKELRDICVMFIVNEDGKTDISFTLSELIRFREEITNVIAIMEIKEAKNRFEKEVREIKDEYPTDEYEDEDE